MKQTLAILTEGRSSALEWIRLFKDTNCKLLICSDCNQENTGAEEQTFDVNVSYEPCAKDAAWEADLLLIETGLVPLTSLLPSLSAVAANKLVLVYSTSDDEIIAEKVARGLPYSTLGFLEKRGEGFIIHLINHHNLQQARTILQDINFPFTDSLLRIKSI